MHTHWTAIARNPISTNAQAFVKIELRKRYRGSINDLNLFWPTILADRVLLDIGVVEHSMDLADRDGWRHGIFSRLATKAVGVDILESEVQLLRDRGFDVRLADATSDIDLGERFDVVYIGDVIEHVNDPVKLLQFAARHLRPDGRIYVTTPCPFWWRNIVLMIKDQTYIGNVDHLRWVTPVNALETAHRAGVDLDSYHTVDTWGHTALRRLGMKAFEKMFGRSELFTWAYVFVFVNRSQAQRAQHTDRIAVS
jgi:SAM-dependent methyltransferase